MYTVGNGFGNGRDYIGFRYSCYFLSVWCILYSVEPKQLHQVVITVRSGFFLSVVYLNMQWHIFAYV